MTHRPKVPKEQSSFADHGARSVKAAMDSDRRDRSTGVQSDQPGDADVNLDTQGRFGNLRQNLTTQWKVQDR